MSALYGYAIAAFLAISAIAGATGYWYGGKHATTAADVAMQQHLADDRKAESDAKDKVRVLEQQLALAQNAISHAYEKGKKDAEATAAAVAADLRSGNLRLQQRWAGCEADRMSLVAATASELDAAARDREESAGRIVRAAAACDAQVRGLQSLLMAYTSQTSVAPAGGESLVSRSP